MEWSKAGIGALLLAALTLIASCSRKAVPAPRAPAEKKIFHVVQRGDTLFRIGQAYGIPYQAIARANDITDPSRIFPGQRLLIPGAKRLVAVPAPVERPRRNGKHRPRPDDPRFAWPVLSGRITSPFGPRRDGFHDGIDIGAPHGAPVRAAADGEVIYAATLGGYGKLIILQHIRGYASVYAHNDELHVCEGDRVSAGQLIASVGRTGRTTGPNLHFEIRHENVAVNPLHFLPPTLPALATSRD